MEILLNQKDLERMRFLINRLPMARFRVDRALGADAAVFRSLMVWFYIANEGLSILENLTLAGVPFPPRIRDALEQLQKRDP